MTPRFDFLVQNSPLYPFRFSPIYKDYLWGGDRFRTFFRRIITDLLPPLAESWEIADHPNGLSVIRNGVLRGKTLHQIVRARPLDLFGVPCYNPATPPDRFPLMLKFLDSKECLSVQVHPDDDQASRLGYSDPGKTEAWIVVDAEPGSCLWLGTDREYSREELSQLIRQGDIVSHLNRIAPAPGDCFVIPPGTIHALGAGLLVAEIQTASDITFRLHDWNRTDRDGRLRELKIEEALLCLDETSGPVSARIPQPGKLPYCQQLVQNDDFILNRWTIPEPFLWQGDGRCHLLTVLQGSVDAVFTAGRRVTPWARSGRVTDPDAIETLHRGDSLLVPAACHSIRWVPENKESATLMDVVVQQCFRNGRFSNAVAG